MPGNPEPRVSWFSSSDYGRDKPGALWLAVTERALTFRLGRRQPLPGVHVAIRVGDGDRHVGRAARTAPCVGCGCEGKDGPHVTPLRAQGMYQGPFLASLCGCGPEIGPRLAKDDNP
jgi:hypothetical protein